MGKPKLPPFKSEWLQPVERLTSSELGALNNWFKFHTPRMDRVNQAEANKAWAGVRKEITRRRRERRDA